MEWKFRSIGTIRSCFKEKFGIPRQAGLVQEAQAVLKLEDSEEMRQALSGMEGFSHVWVVFVFHKAMVDGEWKPKIRPPRLGGSRKMGALASRTPHRPNPLGLSAVVIEKIDAMAKGGPEILVRGGDFLDGTPILDLKPYLPYADSFPEADAGWAEDRSEHEQGELRIEFSEEAEEFFRQQASRPGHHDKLKELIRQILAQDPRPASQRDLAQAEYAFRLHEFDVHWEARGWKFFVSKILVVD